MPSVSERIRRPMDESMLLRLVMVSGLMRGSDLAGFYSPGGGGLDGSSTLEDFLLANGVDAEHLNIVKRAYVETSNFGSTLLESMSMRRAGEEQIRAMRKALNVCETEQLLAIKRGEPPQPIGEMLVARGLLTRPELERIIRQQGMLAKIERYTSEAGQRPETSGGRSLRGLWGRMAGKGTAIAAVALLLAVGLGNLWLAGAFRSEPDLFSRAGSVDGHLLNLRACYANMMRELRHGRTANAEYYRGLLADYFERLDAARITIGDPDATHIRESYAELDFSRLDDLPQGELLKISQQDMEKKMGAAKP